MWIKVSYRAILTVLLLELVNCQNEPTIRQYSEIITPSPISSQPTQAKILWTPPKGWEEQPGNPNRVASFRIIEEDQEGECSITIFPGMVGDLTSNIQRWAG